MAAVLGTALLMYHPKPITIVSPQLLSKSRFHVRRPRVDRRRLRVHKALQIPVVETA
jgi:hypothetical protein